MIQPNTRFAIAAPIYNTSPANGFNDARKPDKLDNGRI